MMVRLSRRCSKCARNFGEKMFNVFDMNETWIPCRQQPESPELQGLCFGSKIRWVREMRRSFYSSLPPHPIFRVQSIPGKE